MFLGYPSKPREHEVPIRHIVPNLITTLSLCAGLSAIHFALKPDWDRAITAVLIAAVLDGLDGRAARMLNATSRFGAVLDSLADFLAFGVAPGIILHRWLLADSTRAGHLDIVCLAAVMTYVLCAALRLARFTASAKPHRAGQVPSRFFVGLPTPAAAAIVLIPPMLRESKFVGVELPLAIVVAHTFFIAGLQISRQPLFSFKRLRVHRRSVVPLMALVGLIVVAAIKDFWLALASLSFLYLLTLPASIVSYRRARATGQESAPPPAIVPDEPHPAG
ncbi:MAG: phosphatidylcholine/phosphatidylserine synthase [Phycisphaeraceae bacterium]|nr:phosphatidylcholine/phosphatidylserine synthase [Phycisphaerae bacterium]MBX3391452.1 phosphatidylcholine/phosphatidylserine synthase [Phycisphaeraceae bacterium]